MQVSLQEKLVLNYLKYNLNRNTCFLFLIYDLQIIFNLNLFELNGIIYSLSDNDIYLKYFHFFMIKYHDINTKYTFFHKLSKEYRFWSLVSGLSVKIDKHLFPDSIFFFRNDRHVFEYNSKTGSLYFTYESMWSIFEREYKLTYSEIQAFIKAKVEEHFNCKDITPIEHVGVQVIAVEEHFNCKDITPDAKAGNTHDTDEK